MAFAKRRPWVLAVAGLIVAWGAMAAFALLSANREFRAGLRGIDKARRLADASAVIEGRLLPDLRNARDHFAAGHARVNSGLLVPARALPVVGRQLRSVDDLSAAATTVANIAIEGITAVEPVLAEPGGSNAARASSARHLGQVAARADTRLARVELGPRIGLLGPLAKARNRLANQVAELRDALGKAGKGGAAVADVLQGPRRYLVFAANNSEMRAGSGMLLSAGELETGPEGLRLSPMRSVTDIPVPPGAVPLTGDLADRWGWLRPNTEWRNLMTSPRFDAVAPVAAQMWVAAGNLPVDGVMVLDPVALGGLLRATGPVEVEGRRYDEGNVQEELLHSQYVRLPSGEERPERRETLGRIAGAIFSSLDSGSWSLAGMATGLSRSAGGRHLLMWAAAPGEQSAWQALGVNGALDPNSVMLSVVNRGGNKLDRFLRVESEISVAVVERQTEITVRVHIENRVPTGEPSYIAGPDPRSGVGEGVYVGILAMTVPGSANGGRFEGVNQLAVQGRDGPSQVFGFQFELPRQGRLDAVAVVRLPGTAGEVRIEPSARVPATTWRSDSALWTDHSERILVWDA